MRPLGPDSRERFTATVDDYAKHRPDYPPALIDWVTGWAPPPADVVDLGAGTGISSRLFAAAGYAVVGVEPNAAMRTKAAAHGGGPRYVAGEAAATGLPAASADLVLGAQAWHWFDLDATLPEVARVLRPDGYALAVWNLRAATGLSGDYDALLRAQSTTFAATPDGHDTIPRLIAHPRVRDAVEWRCDHAQTLDRAGLHGRAHSSSYVKHGVADLPAYDRALDALFDRHAVGGEVTLHYVTRALRFRAASG
jgi:SAM-dependent methyltransferase